jgi:hypothetical protein
MTEETKRAVGRPRAELGDEQRARLVELAERSAVAEAAARDARTDLERAAREAFEGGASVRAIGEAVGLSRGRVHTIVAGE